MRRNPIFLLIVILVLQIAPYLVANFQWGHEWVFGGFLLNPLDGNSYLSKMQEGWAGQWRFNLLYSPDDGKGAYLFLFYLLLGQVAHWFSLPLLLVFHTARLLSILALFTALRKLCSIVFQANQASADFALWLVFLGSGMGWVAALSGGGMTGDFWIAEAYPFLSMFANPHFPLGLAMVVWIVTLDFERSTCWKGPAAALLGLLLAAVQPFGVVILAGILLGRVLWVWRREHRFNPASMLWALSLGGVYLLYQFWAIRTDPLLAQWDAQNQTPALAGWDIVISLLPALAFALLGAWRYWKQSDGSVFLLVFWLAFALLLVNIPFNLQRRFMTGLYVPVALLAASGAAWLAVRFRRAGRWALPFLLGFSLMTNMLILISAVLAVRGLVDGRPDPSIYLSRPQVNAMNWLRDTTAQDAVVLARADTGLIIPAWAGRRVVYGHPYESVHADQRKMAVTAYFEGLMSKEEAGQFLRDSQIDYIFVEASKQGGSQNLPFLETKVYSQDGIEIYRVSP